LKDVTRNVTNILNQDERGELHEGLRHDQVPPIFERALTELEQSSHLIQDNLIKPTTNLLDMVAYPKFPSMYI
jgi:hypothetical protein